MRPLLLLLLILLCPPALAAVDINTATRSELAALPGIGPSKARAIVVYRSAHGPFTDTAQLDRVPGIGLATLANIRPLITLGDTAAPTPAAAADADGVAPSPTVSLEDRAGRVDINTATPAMLDALPGIGPSRARAIVAHREAHGPFATCEALAQIDGVGPATIAALRDRCVAGAE